MRDVEPPVVGDVVPPDDPVWPVVPVPPDEDGVVAPVDPPVDPVEPEVEDDVDTDALEAALAAFAT